MRGLALSRGRALTWLLGTAVALVGLFLVALARIAPPSPRGASEPEDAFSAERAKRHLVALSRGGERPVGSEAVGRARAYAENVLVDLGFETDIQKGMSCADSGACALVRNLVARRRGTSPGAGAVLLMAHLDSVPASAGASDDGLGVAAVLETARALSRGKWSRPVLVVLTDGEEAGLLGARLFHAKHPLAKTVQAVINVEARGSRGPSLLFETLGGGETFARVRAALPHPVTTSLFAEAYRRMPNDTDFSVFRGDPVVGVNFANVLGIEDYHTGHDNPYDVDLGTLQHHGDQALAAARLYLGADALSGDGAPARDVWFDVLGTFVVAFPAWTTVLLAALATAGLAFHAFRTRSSRVALLAAPSALVAGLAASALIALLLRIGGAIPAPWLATPLPAALAEVGAGVLAALASATLAVRRASGPPPLAMVWLPLAALGLVLAVAVPAASYVLVVPSLAAALLAGWRSPASVAITALVAGVLWLPLVPLLYAAAGVLGPAVAAIPILLATVAAPLLALGVARAERRASVAVAGVTVACAIVAFVVPPFSSAHPQRVNVVVRTEDGTSRVAVLPSWGPFAWGEPPAPMMAALGPSSPAPDFGPGAVASQPAATHAEGPRLDDVHAEVAGGRRHVTLRVTPSAYEDVLVLGFPRRSLEVSVDDVPARPRDGRLVVRALPREGVRLAIDAEGDEPLAVRVDAVTRGVAESALGRAVVAARPRAATPTQDGDVSIARQDVRW